LVAAAGELATAAGITGWPEHESMSAAQVCFGSWLGRRGATGTDTSAEVINQVRRFIQGQSAHKFQLATSDRGNSLPAASRLAGFRCRQEGGCTTYFVDPDVFRRDVCAGFDPQVVLRILKVRGFLEHDLGRHDKSVRLPGTGKKRVYAIKAGILDTRSTVQARDSGDTGDNGDNSSDLPKAGKSIRPRHPAFRSADSADAGTALTTGDTTAEEPEAVETQISPNGADSRHPISGSCEE